MIYVKFTTTSSQEQLLQLYFEHIVSNVKLDMNELNEIVIAEARDNIFCIKYGPHFWSALTVCPLTSNSYHSLVKEETICFDIKFCRLCPNGLMWPLTRGYMIQKILHNMM